MSALNLSCTHSDYDVNIKKISTKLKEQLIINDYILRMFVFKFTSDRFCKYYNMSSSTALASVSYIMANIFSYMHVFYIKYMYVKNPFRKPVYIRLLCVQFFYKIQQLHHLF